MIGNNTIVAIMKDYNSDNEITGVINDNKIQLTDNEGLEGIGVNIDSLVNVVYKVDTENNIISKDRNQTIQTIEERKNRLSIRNRLKAEMV